MVFTLYDFVVESNRIEGINRKPHDEEIIAHEALLEKPQLNVIDLEEFVNAVQPGAVLRRYPGMDVYVGDHTPPRGGPDIYWRLHELLTRAKRGVNNRTEAWEVHIAYETLHPFMDGNGRSGRALWLWMMPSAPLGFLHHFYYQTLAEVGR